MTNVIYNIDIPDGPNNPSVDQPKMKTNTNSLKALIEVDHVGFGNNHGGYHQVIHQETQSSVNTIAGVNQVFSGIPGTLIVNGNPTNATPNNGDTQLYSLSGQGSLSQLTGNAASQNGFQWIGQTLIQWGKQSSPGTAGTIQFSLNPNNVAFPNNLFSVTATVFFIAPFLPVNTKDYGVFIDTYAGPIPPATFTKAGFNYEFFAQTNAAGFFWVAIGN